MLAACGDDARSDPAVAPTTSVVTADDLEGQSFGSTEVTGHELVPGTRVSLTFAEQRVSAVSRCNTQNADVDVVGGRLRITSELASTSIQCAPSLRAQDRWIADFLHRGPVLVLEGSVLTLTEGDEVITLEAKL